MGDGGFRGDGPVFDDGVATKISLMGVLAAASKSVAMLDIVNGRIRQISGKVTIFAGGGKLHLRGGTYKAIHDRWPWF
jgi:hypothetical protein